ncbi:VWA domain-containing protein [Brachybacterium sp. ACRRE]|uniref:vWA domain-containing protein n=1 Tax=Brachybacterium sp. ACRRE TaxID=2918184 RepID=UPI001EF2C3BA|nr:VWA domain-containing protein [Brachybacterium sp. ACRRE]MCG7308421.1 VWA domain-containing protein [Brachybacterium sp. ACRRE]
MREGTRTENGRTRRVLESVAGLPGRAVGLAAVLGLLAALLLPSAPALADPTDGSDGSGGTSGSDVSATVPTMLILDSSGSMAAEDGDSSGSTRMEAARKAATTLVDDLPEGAQLGLTVYGAHTGNTAADRTKGCQDVQVVTPVGADDSEALKKGIAGTGASGYTPIGTALKEAAAALPTSGDRAIVLVSDGIDSCSPPPPCEVAKQLKKEGVDLTIHAIGFRVDAKARAELSCITDATGGTYSDASSGDELEEQLVTRTTRTLQGYEVGGTPVSGGGSPQKGAVIQPGDWLDTFDRGAKEYTDEGEKKYYRIDLAKGQRLHASATIIPPPGDNGIAHASSTDQLWLDADVVDSDGTSCAAESDGSIGSTMTADAPVGAQVDSAPAGDDGCATGPVYLEVERSGTKYADQPLPVEITVAIEKTESDSGSDGDSGGSANGDGAGTAANASENKGTSQGSAPKSLTDLGRSPSSAPLLGPGDYEIEMVPGDFRALKVQVDEGQKLSWTLEPEDDSSNSSSTELDVTLRNPLRQVVFPQDVSAFDEVHTTGPTGGGMSSPVQLANRSSDDRSVSTNWLGGRQEMDLALTTLGGTDADATKETVRYHLTIGVDGEAGKNPGLVTEPTPPKAPAAGSGDAPGTSDGVGGGSAHAGSHGSRTALVVGAAGAGTVALLAAGAALALRARRRRR